MSVRHELFQNFDAAYESVAPWDIDHPQDIYVKLAQTGAIQGSVLDAGCGTGENTLHIARTCQDIWGVDISPLAIQKAREKASERGLQVTFQVGDALTLSRLGRTFDTVIDCGLMHNFSDEERTLFIEELQSVLRPGGKYFLHCFSKQLPGGVGPRGITPDEISTMFSQGWQVNSIRPTHFELSTMSYQPPAWIAEITRTAE